MIITAVNVQVFSYPTRRAVDSAGHAHPGDVTQAKMALLRIKTECGNEGFAFGAPELIRPYVLDGFVRKVLVGANAFDREKNLARPGALATRQRKPAHRPRPGTGRTGLWDWAGRKLKVPVHKLIGGYRDKVPAYGSTMCGDELPGGLSTPEEYGRFAETLVKRGYKAIKLHTWMPPVSFAPSVSMDIKACAAVREAVGPDIALMIDGYHWYSRTEALTVGRALEKLNFAWFEEPMMEDSAESYAWLAAQLDIPVLGPESSVANT